MKQSVWGYAVLVLGVMAIMITWFFTQVTNTDQHNYNLLKETVEAAMYDAIDLSAYRKDGSIEINEVKFIESFVRRFAENADLSNTYDISIYDVSTKPPKVSLSVNSCKQTNGTNCNNNADNLTFTISNRVDAILETEWTKQEPQDVKITFKISGFEDKTSIVKEGETIILPSVPNWCNDKTPTFKDSTGRVYQNGDIAIKDTTLEFQCMDAKKYNITYNLAGGTQASSGVPGNYTYGMKGTTINGTPTRTGYTFAGWCTNSGLTNCSMTQTISTTSTGDITFYAKWTVKSYNITYNLAGGTNYSGAPGKYTYGKGATINGTPTRTNYTFKGWCTNSKLENCSMTQTISTTSTGNKTFYAKWVENKITCSAGKYYNGSSCTECLKNYACPGGTFNKNGTKQGISKCEEGKTSPAGSSSCSNICTYIAPDELGGAIGKVAKKYGVDYTKWIEGKTVLVCTCTYGSCKAADYKNCYTFKGNTCKGDNGCGYIGYGSHFKAMCYAVKY